MPRHITINVPEFILERNTMSVITRGNKTIVVPANVFNYELFAQAMIMTQFDAMNRWIKENYKKTIEDILNINV